MPPLPKTLEESNRILEGLYRYIFRPSHIFIDKHRFTEGWWLYRDREANKIFIVTLALREGLPVAIISFEDGIKLIGTIGERDTIERNHAQGQEIIPLVDNMGDFLSPAETVQGQKLS